MKKIVLFFLVCLFFSNSNYISAQGKYGFEFELGAQGVLGSKTGYQKVSPGIGFFVEGRINLPESEFDIGLQVSVSTLYRETSPHIYATSLNPLLLFVSDYSFKSTRFLSPFVGLGVGAADCRYDYLEEDSFTGSPIITSFSSYRFAIVPRIGVELFKHVRVTLDYRLTGSSLSNFI